MYLRGFLVGLIIFACGCAALFALSPYLEHSIDLRIGIAIWLMLIPFSAGISCGKRAHKLYVLSGIKIGAIIWMTAAVIFFWFVSEFSGWQLALISFICSVGMGALGAFISATYVRACRIIAQRPNREGK